MPREIAVVIPHLGLYGGNLRYVELGNVLTDRGVDFTIATPEGAPPTWLAYRGRSATIDELRSDPPEFLLASEQRIFDEFLTMPAGRRVFYFIVERTAAERDIARAARDGKITLLANSTGLVRYLRRRYDVAAAPVVGGVNVSLFRPLVDGERERRPRGRFTIVANGRFSRRRKGTRVVAKSVDGLVGRGHGRRDLELRFFDTTTVDHVAGIPPDFRCRARVRMDLDVPREALRLVYGAADLFVSAEKRAGWSNGTIEAMACGVPVVCTSSGTTDFAISGETALVVPRTTFHLSRAIRRLIEDEPLRRRLAGAGLAKAREFAWERTADQMLSALGLRDSSREKRTIESA